jgi:hypothetical protein
MLLVWLFLVHLCELECRKIINGYIYSCMSISIVIFWDFFTKRHKVLLQMRTSQNDFGFIRFPSKGIQNMKKT